MSRFETQGAPVLPQTNYKTLSRPKGQTNQVHGAKSLRGPSLRNNCGESDGVPTLRSVATATNEQASSLFHQPVHTSFGGIAGRTIRAARRTTSQPAQGPELPHTKRLPSANFTLRTNTHQFRTTQRRHRTAGPGGLGAINSPSTAKDYRSDSKQMIPRRVADHCRRVAVRACASNVWRDGDPRDIAVTSYKLDLFLGTPEIVPRG